MPDIDARYFAPGADDEPGIVIAARVEEIWTAERCYIRELMNTPDRPDLSLAMARVPRGVTTRLHRLVGVKETYLVRSGRGRVEVNGVEADVGPGDAVEIPAGAPQRISNRGDEDLVFFCLCTPRFVPACYEDLEEDESRRA